MNPLAPPLPPPPDGAPSEGPPPITRALMLGMAGALLGSVASNLDTRLTAFSLQDLQGGAGLGVDPAAWVSLAYDVAEVAVVPVTPWLASIISPRRAIAGAVALLTVAGAFVPVAASSLGWLVGLRFMQGLGGGALIPLLLLTVLRFTPPHQRVLGLTAYSLVTAATPLLAEGLAGLLLTRIGWQSVFYIALPLGPLVVLMVMAGLPVEDARLDAFVGADYGGMLLLALFGGTLTAAMSEGQRLDWFDSPLICALFVAATLFLAAFLLQELTHVRPLLDLSLLRRFNFSGGLLMVFVFAFASVPTGALIPSFGEQVRGLRELEVGEILVWGALAQLMLSAVMPFVLRCLEARVVLALGLLMALLADRLGTFVDSDWVAAEFSVLTPLSAAAQLLVLVPIVVIATSTLQPQDALSGGTIFNVVRNLAVTTGGAVMGGIMTVRERVHSFHIVDHLARGAPLTVAREQAGGLGLLSRAVRVQATVEAIADAFGWGAMVVLGSFALVMLLRKTAITRPPR